jgi:Gluconate 2-dehydrogenase subunit 3
LRTTRREFVLGACAAVVGAQLVGAGGLEAMAAVDESLSSAQTETLVAWCELLVPGAREADVGDFVGDQLSKPHADARLLLRYITWPPPYDAFYAGGVAALDDTSQHAFGRRFVDLSPMEQGQLRDGVLAGTLPWSGPPVPLFYMVTRSDAVDVVYGTKEGFARIGFPYQPLIEPPSPW